MLNELVARRKVTFFVAMSKQTKIQSQKWTNAAAANVSLTTDSPSQSDKLLPTMDTTALKDFRDSGKNVHSFRKPVQTHYRCDVEDIVAGLEVRLTVAEKNIEEMAVGMDDMENRSRRDNICVLNLEEGMEGKHPIQFFLAAHSTWLRGKPRY